MKQWRSALVAEGDEVDGTTKKGELQWWSKVCGGCREGWWWLPWRVTAEREGRLGLGFLVVWRREGDEVSCSDWSI